MARADSRDVILSAARAEFASHGFAGARVDRIAAVAGLNKQLIYYYFGSKAALHAAVAAASPLVPAHGEPTRTGTATESLRAAITGLIDSLAARPEVVSLLVDPGASAEARRRAAEWLRTAEDSLARTVSAGQGLGYFRDDVDPHRIARQALVLCAGFLALSSHLQVSRAEWVRDVGETLVRATAW